MLLARLVAGISWAGDAADSLSGWSCCSVSDNKSPLSFCVSVCSLCRASVWIKDHSIWSVDQWEGTLPGCTLPITQLTWPASPWFARQVNSADVSPTSCFSVYLPESELRVSPLLLLLCPLGLIYPTETKFLSRLRESEKSQVEEPNPLIPYTLQGVKDMLALCCCNPPNIPRQVQRVLRLHTMWHMYRPQRSVKVVSVIFSCTLYTAVNRKKPKINFRWHAMKFPVTQLVNCCGGFRQSHVSYTSAELWSSAPAAVWLVILTLK